jgi:hypothetical protein
MSENDTMDRGGVSRLGPDPSLRTLQTVQHDIAALEKLINTRLDAMDKELTLFREGITRVPTEVDKGIGNLQARIGETFKLYDEQFRSIGIRFLERDARQELAREDLKARQDQARQDAETRVSAAFAAADQITRLQNETSALAIAKSEAATAKQIEQLQSSLQTAVKTLDSKIDSVDGSLDGKVMDVKERCSATDTRVTAILASASGQTAAQTTQQSTVGQWVGVIGAAVGIAALLLAYSVQSNGPVMLDQPVPSQMQRGR